MGSVSVGGREERAKRLFMLEQQERWVRTDRNFAVLMVVQFLFGIGVALWVSPLTWSGELSSVHPHLIAAVLLGGLITSLPVTLAYVWPGRLLTRQVIAVGQVLMGALLIHLTEGRIETHFHLFGSLAFLAFYRDWRVLLTATGVIAADHIIRGAYWPLSIYSVDLIQPMRWFEHIGWVLFEVAVLLVSINQSLRQSRVLALRHSEVELDKDDVQAQRDRFFDLSLDMLCVASADGYFLSVNPMFSVHLGYTEEELTSQPFLDLVHPDDVSETIEAMGKLSEGIDVVDFENRYRCKDGRYVWLSWASRAGAPGEPVYAIARDVTNRRQESEELEQARLAAEQANRAKSQFLANMSHEIRTPMNAVIGLAELVLDGELTATQRDYVSTILESGDSLMTIIDEILDFSKIEAGKVELEPREFWLRQELADWMKSVAPRAHRKHLEIAWLVDEDVPELLVGDATRIRQVLVNLVGNAIKFTESGEVVVRVRVTAVKGNRCQVTFEIQDTGIGIPQDKLDAIFSEFEQADMSTTRRFGGTGLGLSISSRLVDLMDGEIGVESREGEGSTFAFTLPLTSSPDVFGELEGDERASIAENTSPLKGLPVLILEDHGPTVEGLERIIRRCAGRPVLVSSVQELWVELDRLKPTAEQRCVVLADAAMALAEDPQLFSVGSERYTAEAVLFVALTAGVPLKDLAREGVSASVVELHKPVKPSELCQVVSGQRSEESSEGVVETSVERVAGDVDGSKQGGLDILLVEDGLANQKLAMGLLKRWGHRVSLAENGLQAVERWETEKFDLILMDLQMPEMGGLEATETIRRRELERGVAKRVPIIAMTAHALKGDREKCLEAGMDGYVAKPVRRAELMEAIQPFFPGMGESGD